MRPGLPGPRRTGVVHAVGEPLPPAAFSPVARGLSVVPPGPEGVPRPFRRPVPAVPRAALLSVRSTLPPAPEGTHPRAYSSHRLGTDTHLLCESPPGSGTRLATIASVSVLPLVFTSGWASGINAYAVVLLLGVFGVTGLSDEVPAALQRTDVLITVGVLFVCELVADKIPYVDTAWDVLQTVVRPVTGAVVAALLAGESGSLPEITAGAIGGSTALISHLVKAGTRMAVNTSPEPFSNIVVSAAEDLGVAGIITFAVFHPLAAAIIAATLLLLGLVTVVFLTSRIRRFLRRRARRRERKRLYAAHVRRPPA